MPLVPTFLDYETFWSKTHSLSKMDPFKYVMHPETEIISCAIAAQDIEPICIFGEDEVRYTLKQLDWKKRWAIAHNMSRFDAFVHNWRLGIAPALWGCTLAMARPIHDGVRSLSLASLAEYYKVGIKNQQVLLDTQGRHLADFTPEERRRMAVYNTEDTMQCRGIFYKMLPHYTAKELWHIHAKIRALVQPSLMLNKGLLNKALAVERVSRRNAILDLANTLGLPPSEDTEKTVEAVSKQLSSSKKFAELLESQNVPVPLKPSPRNPEKLIPALSKTDEAFIALQSHENPLVAEAATARLAVKSNLMETRAEKFLHVANLTGGYWPITVDYCGASTTGRGSGWFYNPLNLPRIGKRAKNSDNLRRSVIAPPGFVIVVADSSGIELRFNHFLWRVPYSTNLWKEDPKADLYRASYAIKLGCTPAEVTDAQRQASKVENLALGFGMGAEKYVDTARVMGGLIITREQAEVDVPDWRRRHKEIVRGWRTCHDSLSHIHAGVEREIDPHGMFVTCREGIRMPSGRLIRYPNLRKEPRIVRDADGRTYEDGYEWWYGVGRHSTRIYAGKIDENIVQAGARDVVYDVAYDVYRQTGYHYAHEVYDELVYVVRETEAEDFLKLLQDRMRKPVGWFPELVLWSEGDIAACYGDAK